VHLRRAILLFALVLGVTALVASVSPSRDSGTPAPPAAVAPPPSGGPPRTLAFDSRPGSRPALRTARAGEHVVLSVASTAGGLVTIPRLGRAQSASPATPALFDLLAPPGGRYDVMFAASGLDAPRRVGTLVTLP
jgi:hypothetical protein